MHSAAHWTGRQLELGRTAIDAAHRWDRPRVRLEVYDGGAVATGATYLLSTGVL